MNAEDRFCSDCGFADYCMRERSCYRRDQGEIRSPNSESARGDLTSSAQPDAGATSSSGDAPRPKARQVLVLGTPLAMTLAAAFRINAASASIARQQARWPSARADGCPAPFREDKK